MRRRWAIVLGLAENWWQCGVLDPARTMAPGVATPRSAARHWVEALHGGADPAATEAILAGLGGPPDVPLGAPDADRRIARIAALAAMAPAFQVT
jgi:hypothetical protein